MIVLAFVYDEVGYMYCMLLFQKYLLFQSIYYVALDQVSTSVL